MADRFNHDGIGNFLIGTAVLGYSLAALQLEWTLLKALCLVLAVLGGGLVFVALNFITCSTAFWVGDSVPVTLAVHEWHEFAKFPLTMYSSSQPYFA